MKKIKNFIIDNSFIILMIIGIIIGILFYSNLENIYFIVGILVILICFIITLINIILYKNKRKEIDNIYGKSNVNKIISYLDIDIEKEYKRLSNNEDVLRILEFVQYNCNDLLNLENKIEYLDKDYKNDIKYIKNIKGINSFINRTDEIMNIIFKYYDKDGNKL